MSNQVQGEILFEGITAPSWVYSPWIPVRGDKATFAIEILQREGVTVTWNVQTRTLESTATSELVSTSPTANTVGVHVVEADGLTAGDAKQLVRYMIATGGTVGSGDASKWVQLRVLEPSWQLDGR